MLGVGGGGGQNGHVVAPGSRRLLKSQRSRAKQLVAMNVAGGNALLIEQSQESQIVADCW